MTATSASFSMKFKTSIPTGHLLGPSQTAVVPLPIRPDHLYWSRPIASARLVTLVNYPSDDAPSSFKPSSNRPLPPAWRRRSVTKTGLPSTLRPYYPNPKQPSTIDPVASTAAGACMRIPAYVERHPTILLRVQPTLSSRQHLYIRVDFGYYHGLPRNIQHP